MKVHFVFVAIVVMVAWSESTQAQLVRKMGQYIGSQIMRESTEEAVEQGVKQGVRTAAKEAAEASVKAGSANVGRGVITSGAGQAARFGAQYGDEAVKALAKVTPQNARRLRMLSEELASTGHADEIWSMIAKGGRGDQVVDFLWRNKGTLVGGAMLATFVVNPEDVLDGTSKAIGNVTESVGTTIVEPVARETGRTAVHWLGATLFLAVCSLVVCWAGRRWFRSSGVCS